ncbi:type II toxin-antitoxin system RelB/DinJ family antitoxin [bacterium]|nr:type II toxin-antitoxin system RelB/DinJ family antitoxin [bacterium]
MRTKAVKSYVPPEVKREASDVYANLDMSRSDAMSAFLVKSIEVKGIPFDVRPEPRPAYNRSTVLPADPTYGSSVLPTEMDDDEDGLYDQPL